MIPLGMLEDSEWHIDTHVWHKWIVTAKIKTYLYAYQLLK